MQFQLKEEDLQIQSKYKTHNGVISICEFHDDTHPSMFVNLVEGWFYCHACGEYGNVDKLIEVTGGAKKYVPYQEIKVKDDKEWQRKLSFPLAIDDDYLISRNVTNEQVERFEIRSNKSEIIFPLKSNDSIVGLKIRIKNPKNSVKYLTFGKQPLYVSNFDVFESNLRFPVMITEGMFGVLVFDRLGYKAITPLSASRAYGLTKVIENTNHKYRILFDDDIAGYFAAAKFLYKSSYLKNVSSMNVFCDVDGLAKCAIKEIVESEFSTTRNYNDILMEIERKHGKIIYYKYRKLFSKFVER